MVQKIICAHSGASGDEGLYWASFDGSSWSGDTPFSNGAKSTSTPALAMLNNKLYCVHRGQTNDNHLWWSSFDPATGLWTADTVFPNDNRSSDGVALAVFKGILYCVHPGGDDNGLWWTFFDPATGLWAPDQRFNNGNQTDTQPSLVVSGGALYCIHKGAGDQGIWWSVFTGADWTQDNVMLPGAETARSPASIVKGGVIYCVHRGHWAHETAGQDLWWTSFSNGAWAPEQKFPAGNRSADMVGLTVFNDTLYCVHRGQTNVPLPAGADDHIYYTTLTDGVWGADIQFSGGNRSADGIAVAVLDFP